MTSEIRILLSTCLNHIAQVERFLELDQPIKSEFHASELAENAKLLANALYRAQRNSGEVK